MAEIKEAPRPKTDIRPAQSKEAATPASAEPVRPDGNPHSFVRRFAREMDHLFEDFGIESGLHMPKFLSLGRDSYDARPV